MTSFKAVSFAVVLLLTACGSEAGVASSSTLDGDKVGQEPGPDPEQGKSSSSSSGTSEDDGGNSGTETDGGPGADSGGGGPGGPDSGGGGPGGPDAGGPGGPDGGGPGGGVVTSNSHNWSGWASTTACPAWDQAPSSWKEPRTTGVGTQACSAADVFMAGGLYDSFIGPAASASAQTQWLATHMVCASCAFSNWGDPTWGPVVKTPNGHFVLNQAGCVTMKDPSRKSCALSHWQFHQCAKEACDSSVSQTAYQGCADNASNTMNGVCGEASYGLGRANNVLFPNSSTAWSQCISTGLPDDAKNVATRVVIGQCY